MKRYPLGQIVLAYFAFTLRKLTEVEQQVLEEGRGIPTGVGVDPEVVIFDYDKPGTAGQHVEGSEVIRDGVGVYHVVLPGTLKGLWNGRGRGVSATSQPFAATPRTVWEIVD